MLMPQLFPSGQGAGLRICTQLTFRYHPLSTHQHSVLKDLTLVSTIRSSWVCEDRDVGIEATLEPVETGTEQEGGEVMRRVQGR